MKKYRKKPVMIEAIKWTGSNVKEVDSFTEGVEWLTCSPPIPQIPTLEGVMRVSIGDMIIRGIEGEYYPCKPDIFNKTYEEVNT